MRAIPPILCGAVVSVLTVLLSLPLSAQEGAGSPASVPPAVAPAVPASAGPASDVAASGVAVPQADGAAPVLTRADAEAWLDGFLPYALAAGDKQLAGDIQVDRSRALVALNREDEAGMALDEARSASPRNAEGWLLSATLDRRKGNLVEAQAKIEQAALLAPSDPEIGLEAGVIAMLSGREDAARRSWQSVQTIAPDTPAAETATSYLAQLGKP